METNRLCAKTNPEEQCSQVVISCRTQEKKIKICEVCGHSNPESTAICEMCSNYLFLGKGD